ncbi:MAG: capsular polysaccharide biosynthesis protein [Ruminococcaceae bacterium]|nr:capsular polysaccharide biosynthesis protein [Oscillospiraceae bacterium]
MIDWHSHILPGIDDGSRNTSESEELINALALQGVSTIIATPHFYANDETVEAFLERRNKAFEILKGELSEEAPEILLGAEVRYYRGISRLENLKALRIEGTKLLLLEMPMSSWSEYMIRELIELSSKSSIKIILAHVERYLHLQKQAVWERLFENGILMQVNASFFITLASRRKAIALLNEGSIHIVGSDCHNMKSRPPMIDKAFEIIKRKLGGDYIKQINEYGYSLLAIK